MIYRLRYNNENKENNQQDATETIPLKEDFVAPSEDELEALIAEFEELKGLYNTSQPEEESTPAEENIEELENDSNQQEVESEEETIVFDEPVSSEISLEDLENELNQLIAESEMRKNESDESIPTEPSLEDEPDQLEEEIVVVDEPIDQISEDDLPTDEKIEEVQLKLEEFRNNTPKEPEEVLEAYATALIDLYTLSDELPTELVFPYESLVEEKIVLQTPSYVPLSNETYDPEFLPKEKPIDTDCLSIINKTEENVDLKQENKEEISYLEEKIDSQPLPDEVVEEKIVTLPLDTDNTPIDEDVAPEPTNVVTIDLSIIEETPISNDESNDTQQNFALEPIVAPEIGATTQPEQAIPNNQEVHLDKNPYFQNKKMNFSVKKLILSLIPLILVLGLFISLAVVISVFK